MAPMVAAALISAVPQLFKMGEGFLQNRQGKKMLEGLNRPQYQMPSEIDQVLQMAQMMASGPMPGMAQFEEQIGAQMGNLAYDAMSTTGSSGEALAALVAGSGQATQARQGLAINAAQDKRDMQRFLTEALKLKATYKDREFEDRFMQYQDAALAAMGLQQAGRTNMYSGLEGMGRVGSQFALSKGVMNDPALAALFSGNEVPAPETSSGLPSQEELLQMFSTFSKPQ